MAPKKNLACHFLDDAGLIYHFSMYNTKSAMYVTFNSITLQEIVE